MKRRRRHLLCGLILIVTGQSSIVAVSEAQAPLAIAPGRRVRVTWSNGDQRVRITGTVFAVEADSIRLRTDERLVVPVSSRDITRLEVSARRPRSTLRGALIGALLGAAYGAPAAARTYDRCTPESRCIRWEKNRQTDIIGGAAIFGVLGGAIGATIGVFIRHDVWRETTIMRRADPSSHANP